MANPVDALAELTRCNMLYGKAGHSGLSSAMDVLHAAKCDSMKIYKDMFVAHDRMGQYNCVLMSMLEPAEDSKQKISALKVTTLYTVVLGGDADGRLYLFDILTLLMMHVLL